MIIRDIMGYVGAGKPERGEAGTTHRARARARDAAEADLDRRRAARRLVLIVLVLHVWASRLVTSGGDEERGRGEGMWACGHSRRCAWRDIGCGAGPRRGSRRRACPRS